MKKRILTVISIILVFSFFEQNFIQAAESEYNQNYTVVKAKDAIGTIHDIKVLNMNNETYFLYLQEYNNIIQIIQEDNNMLYPVANNEPDFTDDVYSPYISSYLNMINTTRYFKSHFNRSGISDTENLYANVIFSSKVNNAIWNGSNFIVNPSYSTALDIIAHEYTHSIIQNELGEIGFSNETGAIEESLADTFASFIDNNFTIGESLGDDKVLRSLSNPSVYGQPSHYNNYIYTQDDKGGVHINNGIPNYAFYQTYNLLGKDKSEVIYYQYLTNYFNKNSTFSSMKKDLIEIARDKYSPVEGNKIRKIWNKIGIK